MFCIEIVNKYCYCFENRYDNGIFILDNVRILLDRVQDQIPESDHAETSGNASGKFNCKKRR